MLDLPISRESFSCPELSQGGAQKNFTWHVRRSAPLVNGYAESNHSVYSCPGYLSDSNFKIVLILWIFDIRSRPKTGVAAEKLRRNKWRSIRGAKQWLMGHYFRVDRLICTFFHALWEAPSAARNFARRLARDWILFFSCWFGSCRRYISN